MDSCCFRVKPPDPFPIDLAPGEGVRIPIGLKAHEGPFRVEIEALFDDGGVLRTLLVAAEGKAVER